MRIGTFLLAILIGFSAAAEDVLISYVNVLPMTGKGLQKERHVLIEDGRITSVRKKPIKVDTNVRVVDGTGKYLIPGLWDMHVHFRGLGDSAPMLMAANGVLAVRDMGGDPDIVFSLKDDIAAGKKFGPRIFASGGFLETPAFIERLKSRGVAEDVDKTRFAVSSPEDAAAAVKQMKDRGADFIKYRTVQNRNALMAISEAAHKEGLKLAGHAELPMRILVESGQDSFEHYPRELMNNRSVKEREALWRTMASNGTVIVPTLINVTNYLNVPMDDVEAFVYAEPDGPDSTRRYVTPELLQRWEEQLIDRRESPAQNWDRLSPPNYRNFNEMHNAGVHILPGTDTAVVMAVPGFALHQELQALVQHVGLSPSEMLINATLRCAEFMGVDDELGTVEGGKKAELILLNENPSEDIQNTTSIHGVFTQGNYHDRAALDNILEDAIP